MIKVPAFGRIEYMFDWLHISSPFLNLCTPMVERAFSTRVQLFAEIQSDRMEWRLERPLRNVGQIPRGRKGARSWAQPAIRLQDLEAYLMATPPEGRTVPALRGVNALMRKRVKAVFRQVFSAA